MKKESAQLELTWYRIASSKRISGICKSTATDGAVVNYLTNSKLSASSRTRISTFLINAGSIEGTFRTYNAFRSATRRTSSVIR